MTNRLVLAALVLGLLGSACSDDSSGDIAGAPEGSEIFSDPQGSYDMAIDPDWRARHGFLTADTEMWVVGETDNEFAPNVNVIVQLADGELTLQEYVDLSIANADLFTDGFSLVGSEISEGTSGQDLAVMDYEADFGDGPLRFLGVYTVSGNEAVVATLSTTPDTFDSIRASVEPYLLTLLPKS